MNIPLHALVHCTNGDFGHTTCLIVNPINDVITHFVVNDRRIFGREHIVPVSFITRTTEDSIILNCDRATLVHQPNFVEYEYDRLDDLMPYREDHVYWPIMLPDDAEMPLQNACEYEQVPVEALGIRRNMAVYVAAENEDGEKTAQAYFGKVKSFVADAHTGHITHLIAHKICLRGACDVTLPIKSIRKVDDDEVLLNLTSQEAEALPAIRVKNARIAC